MIWDLALILLALALICFTVAMSRPAHDHQPRDTEHELSDEHAPAADP